MGPCNVRQEISLATKQGVESQLFRDYPIRWIGLDMTRTFIICLVNSFNCFEGEDEKRYLLIAMKGSQYGERLVHKLGTKWVKEVEQYLNRRVTGGFMLLVPPSSDRSSSMLVGSCALSQIVWYRCYKVGMPRSVKRFIVSTLFNAPPVPLRLILLPSIDRA